MPPPQKRMADPGELEIVEHVRLDGEAHHLLKTFLESNPDLLNYETWEHRMDPLEDLDEYFRMELEEGDHTDILLAVADNRCVASKSIVEDWIIEEMANFEGGDAPL